METVSVKQIQNELREIREVFLSNRAKQEMWFNEWGAKIKAAYEKKPAIFEGIDIPEVITLQALIPEAYVEYPDEATYVAQLEKVNKFIGDINALCAKYTEAAYAKLREYKSFSA